MNNIRASKSAYMLAYVLELVFYCIRGHYISVEMRPFGFSGSTIMYVFHVAGSLLIMLCWSQRFKPLIWLSSGLFAAGFIPALFIQKDILRLIFICIGMFGLGGAVSACRCGYAFVCNNKERLTGMSLMIILVALIHRIDWLGIENAFTNQVLPIIVITLLVFCLLRFKEEDFDVKEETGPEDSKGLYWAFAFFTAYFAIDGFIYDLANTSRETKPIFMFAGLIIAGIVLFIMLGKLKLNVQHVWDLFFVLLLFGTVLVVIRPYFTMPGVQNLVLGMSVIGWPLCIYMLACALNRFASYKLLKRCTLIFALLSPFTSMMDDFVKDLFPNYVSVAALIYFAIIIALYVLTLPLSSKYLFSQLWVNDMNKAEMQKAAEEKLDQFEPYQLTPRQKEVALLLLEGKTRRQISGELGLSESTVKLHVSELYKRLGINSRFELFKLFEVKK
ncbi:MAG: helix-turn-helix transcriptional regulator [Clostridia bacterium]|nr:helix-turn-helix transcriptional regulator [Clostridia bacterium]